MKQIKISASLGDLNVNHSHLGVLQSFLKNGGTSFRVMNPFAKHFDTDIKKICDAVQFLIFKYDNKQSNVLLCLNDLPYSWLSDYSDAEKLKAYPQTSLEYCNRLPLKLARVQEFTQIILDIVYELESRNILQFVSFELGNEVEAPRYFAGSPQQAEHDIFVRQQALSSSGRPLYISGFTCGTMSVGHSYWTNYINTSEAFDLPNTGFSSHFYETRRKGVFDFQNNVYPSRVFQANITSEFNLFTGLNPERKLIFNSSEYLKTWIRYLTWAADKNISEIFIHPLMTSSSNKDPKSMAIWTQAYDKEKGGSYWIFEPAGKMLYDLMRVISTGYEPIPFGIRGAKESITIINDKVLIENNK